MITSYWCANESLGTSPYSFTYTGDCEVVDDGNDDWRVKFLTSGTFTPNIDALIDAFLVGGGGGGGGDSSILAGGGVGGGYTTTTFESLKSGISYSVVIGDGGPSEKDGEATTAFGAIAYGGGGGKTGYDGGAGTGGSGGGGGGGDSYASRGPGGTGGSGIVIIRNAR